jgi:hypothetical protein
MNKPFARVTMMALLAGGLLALTVDSADAGRRRCRRFACCHTSHYSHSHSHGCCQSNYSGCSSGCGSTCCGYSQGGCCATGSGCNVAGAYAQDGTYHSQQQYTSQPTPYHTSTPTEYYTEPMPPSSQPRSSNPVQSEQQLNTSDQDPAA